MITNSFSTPPVISLAMSIQDEMGIFENLSLSPLSSLLIHPSSAPYTSRPHCTESKNMGTNRPSSRCGLRRHRSPSRSRFSNKVVGLRGRTLGEKSSLSPYSGGGVGEEEELERKVLNPFTQDDPFTLSFSLLPHSSPFPAFPPGTRLSFLSPTGP